MNYITGVAFLRLVCKKYDEHGNFGRYYKALDLLEQAMVLHMWLRGVESV